MFNTYANHSSPTVAVIIVTHNSAAFMDKNLKSLSLQTRRADKVVVVDSASFDTSYLSQLAKIFLIDVILSEENVGFCRANNLGVMNLKSDFEYIIFLNPDVYLPPHFIEQSLAFFQTAESRQVGIITCKLLGFDNGTGAPNGRIDSTGIFRKWYGRWYDRGQGDPAAAWQVSKMPESVPAICGALMFCRATVLKEVSIRNDEVFDESFFMYKEDIDLCLRVRARGWNLIYLPLLEAYHCRGWFADRKKMSFDARVYSARNELRLCLKHPSFHLLYALAKFFYVRGFESLKELGKQKA